MTPYDCDDELEKELENDDRRHSNFQEEVAAIGLVSDALRPLDPAQRERVIRYMVSIFGDDK